MYHINHEGKVYPCSARINKCPYGDDRHAATTNELYYRLMKLSKDAEPARESKNEIATTGRIRSLWSSSEAIANHDSPVDVAIATLDNALTKIRDSDPKKVGRRYSSTVRNGTERAYDVLKYGFELPNYVPADIRKKAEEKFHDVLKGRPIEYAAHTRNEKGLNTLSYIKAMEDDFREYSIYKRYGLTDENKDGTVGWIEDDFYQFSHDLNTSKMLTQPIFYDNIEKARQTIETMDDYELLAAYDDYLLTDKEILENVKLANNFEYKDREDLDFYANRKMKTWYDMNKAIVKDWKRNTPKRVMLSIEMAKELDKRGIFRQDNALGRIKDR